MYRLLTLLFIISLSLADTKTVAISYFDNTSGTEEYNPLSKGLADMLITDLSNVKSLKIVEREKLESLLKEIELGDGKFIDPNTAQKLGKGLGAGFMLTGSFLIMGETMRIDARLVDVGTGEVTMAEEITGEKNTFFELEKVLKDKIINSLSINLSRTESRKIKKSQTESFEAFRAYSFSLDAFDEGEYEESLKFLEKATETDDNFNLAWEKLDELEEELDAFIKAKNLNISKNIIDLMLLIKSGDEDCKNLVGAINKLSTYFAKFPTGDVGELRDNLSKNDFYWLTMGGFPSAPGSLIDVASHYQDRLDEYFSIVNYLIEHDFNSICASEHTYGQELIENIVGHMSYNHVHLPFFFEFINSRYDQNLKAIKYYDDIRFNVLNDYIAEYPYSNFIENVTSTFKDVLFRKKNPSIYEFFEEYYVHSNPNDFMLGIPAFRQTVIDNILILYTSDCKNIYVHPALSFFSDWFSELWIMYIPKQIEFESELKSDDIEKMIPDGFNFSVESDTLLIPELLYELSSIKKIWFYNFNNGYYTFTDKLNKLSRLKTIDLSPISNDEEKRLNKNYPEINWE